MADRRSQTDAVTILIIIIISIIIIIRIIIRIIKIITIIIIILKIAILDWTAVMDSWLGLGLGFGHSVYCCILCILCILCIYICKYE